MVHDQNERIMEDIEAYALHFHKRHLERFGRANLRITAKPMGEGYGCETLILTEKGTHLVYVEDNDLKASVSRALEALHEALAAGEEDT